MIIVAGLPASGKTTLAKKLGSNKKILEYDSIAKQFGSYEELVQCNSGQETIYKVRESELYNAYHDPTLIHFFGPGKLWNKNCNHTYKHIGFIMLKCRDFIMKF